MQRMPLAVSSALLVLGLVVSACAPAAAPTPPARAPTPAPTPITAPTIQPPSTPPVAPTRVPNAAFTPAAAAPTPIPAEKPRYGGILLSMQRGDAPSLDGHQERTSLLQGPLSPAYSLLVQNDPGDNTRIIGDLAEKWEVSPDGKTWTFYLQKGVKFHDGRPATSADVKMSFDRIAWPPKGILSPRQGYFAALDRVDAPDEYTTRFFLKYPQAAFLSILAAPYNWIYPKHVLEDKGDMKKVAVGTGPFKFKDYTRGVSWELVKNPDYFVRGRPYLDGIVRYVIADRAAQLAAIRTQRLHVTTLATTNVTAGERDILKKEVPQLVQNKTATSSVRMLVFNYKRKPWTDIRVRRAVHLVFDHQAAIEVTVKGDGVLGAHFMPGTGWGIPQEELLKLPGYRQPKDQDIAEAKRLLGEAGYPAGFKTTILHRSEPLYRDNSIFLKDQLAKIGIDAQLDAKETGAEYAARFAQQFDLSSAAVGYSLVDPDVIISELYLKNSGSNYAAYYNPQVEELFVKQSQTMDVAERKKLVRQIQDILLEENPAIVYYWQVEWAFWWPEVRDWLPGSTIYTNQKFQDVWLAR